MTKSFKQAGIYVLTFPERLLRALAALLGGLIFSLADLLIPSAIQRTTIYYLLLGGGMRYAVERLAGIPSEQVGTETLPPLPERYQRRKLAGTAIEAAGLLTVGFSPLWVFAIAGDAAAGSKVFLRRLEQHLKQQGVIREDAEVDDLTDLLTALQNAARAMTNVLDTPPLSRAELEEIAARLRSSYAAIFPDGRQMADKFDQLWERMKRLNERRGVDMRHLETLMASRVTERARRARAAVGAVGLTGRELFGEQILEGYRQTLEQAARWGWRQYLVGIYWPFWKAAGDQFSPEAYTLIGDWLAGGRSGSAKDAQN